METNFFDQPILNSPYDYPGLHWELDEEHQPTNKIIQKRRSADFITPIPKPKKKSAKQMELVFDEGKGLSTEKQQYNSTEIINEVRGHVDRWRRIESPSEWGVTPETARLLQHWRKHEFHGIRPFFCQVEAVETIIWLTEVAPSRPQGKAILEHLKNANNDANPGLMRLALKMATGAGKTTVMAMIIAWQTINAVRKPTSNRFTRGFLVVTPGITIKDRLRVLMPNDPDSYYQSRELVPPDLLPELAKAKIVITNYHAFKLREKMQLAKGTRRLLEGRGEPVISTETGSEMIRRVMNPLMNMKNIMVINDEAHHCYAQKPPTEEEEKLKGDDREEADQRNETARLWINGLRAVNKKLGLSQVVDLSATPFFLRGSGYVEGTLFPWTMSDFSLMDAIECGIVKLPRVPVADNIPGEEMPLFRNLWDNIRTKMPKKGRGQAGGLDPLSLPTELCTALDALYGHYEETFQLWQQHGLQSPPCFIVVCNNTSTSKLVYDYISGFTKTNQDGSTRFANGRLALFRNYEDDGTPIARPNTLLIDSEQLESGEALDDNFRNMAKDEIDRFKREIVERTGNRDDAENITDAALLREVMNTVGKPGRLGESIRCVVSVSMLTEGWDANTVTHILGVRAFGTQLLCEQVIGRALRRQSYDLNDHGLFNVEYADVLGIPFDFNAKPVIVKPQPPRETVHVYAVHPERDALEIQFPRVTGYRVELPYERLRANFTGESILSLTPDLVGPTNTQNSGIIGADVNLDLKHLDKVRPNTLAMKLAAHLLNTKWRDTNEDAKLHLFGELKMIASDWLQKCLVCQGGTFPAQLMYTVLADMACDRITNAITEAHSEDNPIKAILDPYNPTGSTRFVNFYTSKMLRWQTNMTRCHINWVICDSEWEVEFCRVAEAHPQVLAYVKNQNLGFEVPYLFHGEMHRYLPDFIVLVDDGHGMDDPLHLVVEVKGIVDEKVQSKHGTMYSHWIPGVNRLKSYGRWAFAVYKDVYSIGMDFGETVKAEVNRLVQASIDEQKGMV